MPWLSQDISSIPTSFNPLCPPCFESKQTFTQSSRVGSRFLTALLLVFVSLPISQGYSPSQCWTPGHEACSVNCSLLGRMSIGVFALFFWLSFQGTWSVYFPPYLILCWSFYSLCSTDFLIRLNFVFSESCSKYRCIFDVFTGGGELYVFLHYYLDLILFHITSFWGDIE